MGRRCFHYVYMATVLLAAACLLITCSEKIINEDVGVGIELRIYVSQTGTGLVNDWRAIISAADMDTLVATMELQDSIVTGRIDGVPEGSNRTVTLEGQDNGNTVIYRGEATGVTVNTGEPVTVRIVLRPQVPMIRLAPKYTTGEAGDSIAVDIKAYNLDSLTMLELNLFYDTTSLTFRQVLDSPADSFKVWLDGSTWKTTLWGDNLVDTSGNGTVATLVYGCKLRSECVTLTDLGVDVTAIQALGIAGTSDVYTDGMTARISSYILDVMPDTVTFDICMSGQSVTRLFTITDLCGYGSVSCTLAVDSSVDWFDLNSTSGAMPLTCTVSVNTSLLTADTVYFDSIGIILGNAADTPHVFVRFSGTPSGANQIILSDVSGLVTGDTMLAGDTVRFTLKLSYGSGSANIGGLTNGFQVWEMGGGDFFAVSADTLPAGWANYFDNIFVNEFSVDGLDRDTVGFGFVDMTGLSGLPVGFCEPTWYIETGSDNAGDTLCIDSSYFPPAGGWLWSVAGGSVVSPSWVGPYCFHVGNSSYADRWNSSNDYSITSNPNDVWSYGRKWSVEGATFDLMTVRWGESGWYLGNYGHGGPGIMAGPSLWAKDNSNGYPVVRWTCPEAGSHDLVAIFIGNDSRGVDNLVYVTINDSIVFSDRVESHLDSAEYALAGFHLDQEDYIDFLLRWNGGVYSEYGWTTVKVTIGRSEK